MSKNIAKIFLFFFYILTLIRISTCQKKTYFPKTRVDGYNEISLNERERNHNSNQIKCSDFIKNCASCNSQQCTKCINNYIFINGNFKECILKDSIELGFYYTNDNISYFSCKDKKYQNNEKCKEFSKTTLQKNLIRQLNQISTIQLSQIPTDQDNPIFTTQPEETSTTEMSSIPTTLENPISIPTTIPHQAQTTEDFQIQTTPITQATQSSQIFITQTENIPTSDLNNNNIPTTQVNSIIPTTQVNKIPTTQANKIPTTQANKIPTTQVYNNTTTQVNPIQTTQLNAIQTTQINKITTTIVNIKTTETVTNTPTNPKPISSTQINKPSDKPDPIPTTPKTNPPEEPKVKEKIFFLLQAQKINMKLFIYLIINFPITTSTNFIFNVSKYKSRNLRNLEEDFETKEINFHPTKNYEGKYNEIVSLESDKELSEDRIVINFLKKEENEEGITVKIANGNSDMLDTQKVKEYIERNGVDFSKIAENENYNFSQYKINSVSNGCEFSLNSESEIKQTNKNIKLNFIDIENKKNISSNCILSSKYNYSIICDLKNEIKSNYKLDPYSSFDNEEAITIFQNDNTDYLQLQCHLEKEKEKETDDNSKKEKGISSGAVAGIIVGIIFIVIAAIVAVIVYKKFKQKQKPIKNDSYNFVPKFYEYPSATSNIYM